MKHLALVLATSVTMLAQAQQAATEVTDAQIAQYKVKLESGCTRDAVQGGLVAAQAQAFCSCTAKQIGESMSLSEWQAATYQSSKQAEREEMMVLVPHIRKAARACQSTVK
jgi:hypothetical protein